MRIIAGTKKGMNLLAPKGMDTRPVTDRVKESIFNIMIKWDLPGDAMVADLFCGTGSMGLEALSRGAKFVTFVDRDRSAVALLEKNIEKAGFVMESKVISHNIFPIGAPVDEEMYDLVFVDPPYELSTNCDIGSRVYGLMKIIDLQVKEGAIVILRTHLRALALELYGTLEQIDKREWGSMKVMFYQKKTKAEILENLQ